MSVTLKDVANLANVSPATVSRVINNNSINPVSPKTAQTVLDAIVALDYSPNSFARNLRRKDRQPNNIHSLGTLLLAPNRSYNDIVFYDILMGIQSEASNMGFSIGFNYTLDNIGFANIKDNNLLNSVDGLIILGRSNYDVFDYLEHTVKHVVYAGLNHIDGRFDEVICDSCTCTKNALNYLYQQGFRKIGYIGQVNNHDKKSIYNEHRFTTYCQTLNELDLELNSDFIINTPMNLENTFQATTSWLETHKELPEVFFCANDNSALGSLRAFNQAGIKIPENLSTISIDDIEMASYSTPPLTTYHVPFSDLGKFAVKTLSDRMQHKRKYNIRTMLPANLIVRGSILSPNKTQLKK